jgi:AcrR family transcriptional regulator
VAVQHGLREMTVAQILEAAGISRRTYYQYFHGKEEAFLAVYEQLVDDLVETVRRGIERVEDPTQRLFAGIEAYLDFQQFGGDLVALMQAEAANPASLLSNTRERALDELVQIIDLEIRRELGEALDPLIYRHLLIGLEGLVIHRRQGGPFSAEDRERISTVVKHLFVATLAEVREMPHAPE